MTGSGADGVRLLSQRPSVLIKVGHLATDPQADASEGLIVAGPGWAERLREVLRELSPGERAGLFAVLLDDDMQLPVPAEQLLSRMRTDWFPEFLSNGTYLPQFQVIMDLAGGDAYGRQVSVNGRLGATEIRAEELVVAAEAHEALFSFEARSRAAALEAGLPALPDGEILFLDIDPRAVVDVTLSVRATFNVVERLNFPAERLCLQIVNAARSPDMDMLAQIADAYRERGALVGLEGLAGGGRSLECLELVRPDYAKLDRGVTEAIELSAGRKRLVAALVECAHEQESKVIADGIERVSELETMTELGVDYGQGFYLGMPMDRILPVDGRLVRRSAQLV